MALRGKLLAIRITKGLKYTVFATNLVVIVLLLLSVKATSIAPSSSIIIAYLGMGFPFLALLNVFYLILWIITFRWWYVIIQLVILVLCWESIYTYFPYNSMQEVPKNNLKVLSYNVRGFDWLTGSEARKNPVFEYLANNDADIICLQEFAVDDKKGRNRLISLQEFDDIMKDYPYRAIVRLGEENLPNIYGLACYSKYPILTQARLPINSAFNGSAMYEIRIGMKKITIVNSHLESNRITAEDKVLYKKLVVEPTQEKMNEMAQMVQKRLEPAFKTREQQADIIANCVKQQREKTSAIILCGDFNDTPISYAYETIRGNMTDSFKRTGRGLGITYHANGFWFRIDYIMHTKNLKSYNSYVDKVKYSDHYPIYSYISLDGL
ncbi:hypothetical protein D0T53_02720 [Dysgonomonas sp. 216]|uniref:endonuclease/exonuclease/phosphatase family protein n=1 Tax=Dysgonomonas sp. 216 TaxID=2302934 RepID=UPI0013D09130|nr:endonuclease/exonuclease/phosphatase family protein [Dysgonomonas sp. 216]NDW17829.1 hypothetical protein [Dysgonomonas sp. 216]